MKRASKRASDCSMPSNVNRASSNENYSQLIAAPKKRRSCSPAIKIETPTMLPHHSQSNTEPAQRTDTDSENVTVKNESYEILPCKVLLDGGDIRRYLLKHSITLEDLFIRSGIELNPPSTHRNKPLKHITIKTEPDDCTDEITNFNKRYLDDHCANKRERRREVNRTVSFVNITVPAATDVSVHDPSQSTSASFDCSKYLKIELLDSAKEPIASDFEEDEITSLECAERIISSPELETSASESSDDNLEYESDKCPSRDGSGVVDFGSLEEKKAVTNTRTQSVKTKQELKLVFRKQNTAEKEAGKREYNFEPRNSGTTSCTDDSSTETASLTYCSYSDSEKDDFIIDVERDDEEASASSSIASRLQERKDEATQIPSEVPKVGDNRTPTAFYCVPCTVKFCNTEQLKSHVLNIHRECLETTAAVPAVKQGTIMVKYVTGVCCYYECPNCFDLFENLKIVSEHLVTVHITEVRKLLRVTCNRVPVKTVKMGPKVPTTGLFHCGYCQRNYTLFEHLRLHMKRDHDILDCQKCLCFYRMSKKNSCPVCSRVTRFNKSPLLNDVAGGESCVKPNSVASGYELIHTMGSFSVKSSTRNNDLKEVLGIRRTLRKPFPENEKGMWTEDDAVAKELKNAPLQQRELVLPDEQAVLVEEEEESADGEEDEYSVEALDRLLKSINQNYKSDNNDFELRESNPQTTRKSPQPRMMSQSSSNENLNGTSNTQQNTDKVLSLLRKMKNAADASPIVDKIPPLKTKSVLESSASPSFHASIPRIRVKPSIVKSSGIPSVQASSFILKTAVIDDASSHLDIRPSSSKGQVMVTTSHGGKVATLKKVATQALQLKTGVFSNVEDLDKKEQARLTDIQNRLQMKRTYKFSSSYLPCIFCDKITDKLKDLVGHLVMKHVYCPQCRENFQSLEHFDNHKELKFYRCSAFGCEQTFRTVTQYAIHDKLVHDCEYVISSEGAKEHEFEVNWEEDSFPCCYCYEYFVCRSVRDQHLLIEHSVAKCSTCCNYVSNRSRCQVCFKLTN